MTKPSGAVESFPGGPQEATRPLNIRGTPSFLNTDRKAVCLSALFPPQYTYTWSFPASMCIKQCMRCDDWMLRSFTNCLKVQMGFIATLLCHCWQCHIPLMCSWYYGILQRNLSIMQGIAIVIQASLQKNGGKIPHKAAHWGMPQSWAIYKHVEYTVIQHSSCNLPAAYKAALNLLHKHSSLSLWHDHMGSLLAITRPQIMRALA